MTDPHPTPSPDSPEPAEPPRELPPSVEEPHAALPEAAPPPGEPPPQLPPETARHKAAPGGFDAAPHAERPGRSALPVLTALGFVLLLGGLAWLWSQQQSTAQQLAEQTRRMEALSQPPTIDPARVAGLEMRLKEFEQRPAAPVADTGKLEASVTALAARLTALEQRPQAAAPAQAPAAVEAPRADADKTEAAAPAQATAPDLGKLEARLAALEARPQAPAAPVVDTSKLEQRLAELEARKPPPPPDPAIAMAPLAQKLDSVAAEATASRSAEAAAVARLGELDARVKQAEQQAASLATQASQAGRVAHAQSALAAGAPLGELPNAPPALARFATVAPPTEAALRLSYAAAADAAEDASRPSAAGLNLGARMWLRARALVTVKQGDTVVVGAPAATVLGEAHARLEAGDLPGTLAVLDRLDGAAAAAMAPWRAQAQALLDARAALAQMVRG